MSVPPAIRGHPAAVTALCAAAAAAWWSTAVRMDGMNAGPGTDLGTLGWFTGSWVVMMAAMMLPSLAPALAASASPPRRAPAPWLPFLLGYLLVWTLAGVLAYSVFDLGKALLGGDLAWHRGGRWLAAGVVAGAAAYELIPLKRVCLLRCRGRRRHAGRARRGSPADALMSGGRSGLWCIGCSGMLMAALFALGVMSLTWMGLIAALIAFEKVGPWPLAARLLTASVLVLLACGILAAPGDVPGLVIPGAGGMHAMTTMG